MSSPPHPPSAKITPALPPLPNVHVLVAFAAKNLSKSSNQIPTARYRYYNVPFDDPRVLDAIAALCVTPEHPQPVAVALTIDSKIHQVRLLISQGGVDRLEESLLVHIHEIWGHLQRLSEYYRRVRAATSSWSTSRGEGQIMNVAPMFFHAYRFHEVQLLQAVREWWPKLDDAYRQFGRALRESGKEPEGLEATFMDVTLMLRRAVHIMGDDLSLLTPADWGRLLYLMDIAAYRAQYLIRQWSRCESWGASFNDSGYSGPSSARRALTNLTSFHRHIDTLATFASYSRASDIFTHTLQVSFLPCLLRPTPLPTDWTPVVRHLCPRTNPHIAAWTATEAAELAATYATTPHQAAPHPECNLVAHLHTHRNTTAPPIDYIGLSDPPCAACDLWLRAYRARGAHVYRIRSTSGVWAWPWAPAAGVSEGLLAMEVAKSCEGQLNEAGIFGIIPLWEGTAKVSKGVSGEKVQSWVNGGKKMCVFGCSQWDECQCFSVLWE